MLKYFSSLKLFLITMGSIILFNFSFCNPKTIVVNTKETKKNEITDECALKEEVCNDAREFQKEYETMPEQEQEDMLAALNTYIEHCENATRQCEESKKKK